MFIAREAETGMLDEAYSSRSFEMVVVFGRRRVGKTRLPREFCAGKERAFLHGPRREGRSTMKIGARNQIEGTVAPVKEGAVNGHVTIEGADGVRISDSITNESIESLGLKEGGRAVAIIKATDVMVAVD